MALNIDPKVVSLIIGAVEQRADGATLNEIYAGFPQDTVRRVVQRWVTALVDAGKLRVDKSAKSSRYFLANADTGHLDSTNVQIAAGSVSTSTGTGPHRPDQENRPADVDNRHVQIAGANVHIPAAPKSTSGQNAGTPAHLDTPGTDVDTQAAGSGNDVDTTHPANVQIAAGAMSTSPGTGARRPDQDNRPADVDNGRVQIAGLNVHIPAGPKSTSGQNAGTPAHLDNAKPIVDTKTADLDKVGSGGVQIGAGGMSTSGSKPSSQPGIPAQTSKPTHKSRKKSAEPEDVPADAAAALLRSIEQLVESGTSVPAHRSADVSAAKSAAKGLMALIPGGRRTVLGAAVSSSAAVLFYLIYHLTGSSNWAVVAMSAGIIAGPLAWSWITKRPAAAAAASDQPIRPDAPAKSPGRFRAFCFRYRFVLTAGALTLLAVGIGIALYVQLSSRPPKSAVSAWLVQKLAPLPVRVAAIDVTYLAGSKVSWDIQYRARLETTEALYQPVEPTAYLRAHFPNEMVAIQAANALLAGPEGARLRAAVAAPSGASATDPPSDFSISACQLLSISAPPGASAPVSGTVTGWSENGGWAFKDTPVYVDRKVLDGESKSTRVGQAAESAVFVVNSAQDLSRLAALIAEHAVYAAKVQAAATALTADLERQRQQQATELERERAQKAADLDRERQQKLTALNQLLQRGTFLSGVVVAVPKPDSYPVLLEVTDRSTTTHEITLVLRNASGWYNTRSGKGTWSIDADNEVCNAKVWFANDERIPGAGRPLDDTGAWYLTLRVRLDGSVSADPRGWDLQRVADADVAAAKAEFGFGRVVASATTGGTVDQRLGGTASDQPIRRSSDTPATVGGALRPDPAPTAPSGATESRSNGVTASDQPIHRTSDTPPLPAAEFFVSSTPTGAYVYADGVWHRLPQNSAKAVQSTPQKLTGLLQNLSSFEDRLAGKSSGASATEIAEIRFDGLETVPVVPANDLIIAYVGPLAPFTASDIERHPELKDYPIIEMAPEKPLSKGVRYAPLYRLPGGFLGFANTRVMTAAVDQSIPNLTILRCTAPLPRGQYAVACGNNSYEVKVE